MARVYDFWLGGKDNDPIVLAHARALLTSSPEGATDYIEADLRATDTILERAAGTLDFGQPVAVMLLGILQGIPDQDGPGAIIARLMHAVPSASYLALTQIASDVAADEVAEGVQRYNEQAAAPVAGGTSTRTSRSGLLRVRGHGDQCFSALEETGQRH